MAGKPALIAGTDVRADSGIGGWREQLAYWRPRIDGPNSTLQVERDDMRARSRELIRTDPIAAGAIHTNVSHVVGTGLSMQSTIEPEHVGMTLEAAAKWKREVDARFLMWASNVNADAAGRLDFFDQQSLVLRSTLSSGDCFTVLPKINVRGWPQRFGVQLLESDRVSNPDRMQDKPGELVGGLRLDRMGRIDGFHVSDHHPGTAVQLKWQFIRAIGDSGRRNMLYHIEIDRPDQVRGRSYLAPVVGKLKDLSRYAEAELSAAVTSAALTIFSKMDPTAFADLFETPQQEQIIDRALRWNGGLTPNTAINLLPGEEIQVADNKRPNENFDPFFQAIVRQIGVGLEIPFEVLIKHYTSSYTAARAAMLDAWRLFRRRRDWISKSFCQPIYEEWLSDEIALGRIVAPGFFADPFRRWAFCQAQWIGDAPGSVDPLKETNAAEKRIQLGISTRESESIAHDGIGWERKHRQLVVEENMRREDGLTGSAPAPGAPPSAPVDEQGPPAKPAEKADEKDDDGDAEE